MSQYPPPLEIVPTFNPANWIESDTGSLTQTQADARYLIKISADTATGFETFLNGISTNSIIAYGGNLVLGNIGASITLLGNTTYANVQNLDVLDPQITVNKSGISPLNAGLQVESSNVIVSSLLNNASADWVLSSANNRIYLDSIGEKTANATITAINPITVDDGSGALAKIEPGFICIEQGSDRGGMKLTPATDFCMGTFNNLDLHIKTNNTNRIDVDGANGNVTILSTVASTGSNTGALVVNGGLGVAGNYYSAGSGFFNGGTLGTFTNTILSFVTNNTTRAQINTAGDFNLNSSTTQSSNVSTGAFRTLGGVGIAKNLNVGGNVSITENLNVTGLISGNISGNVTSLNSNITGNLFVGGLANIRGESNIGGNLRIESTRIAGSTTEGALMVSGGIAVGNNINAVGTIQTAGSLISSKNTSDALQITGGGSFTQNLVVTGNIQGNSNIVISGSGNIVNDTGNIRAGRLLVGTNFAPFEDCPIRVSSTTVDNLVNGTVLGESINLLSLNNGSRDFVFGAGSGSDNVALYLGSSGGVANDPDYFCRWDTGGRFMIHPTTAGNVVAPNTNDLFTCRGNANIISSTTIGHNSGNTTLRIAQNSGTALGTTINASGAISVNKLTPASGVFLDVNGASAFSSSVVLSNAGANILYVGGEANIGSIKSRGIINSTANIISDTFVRGNVGLSSFTTQTPYKIQFGKETTAGGTGNITFTYPSAYATAPTVTATAFLSGQLQMRPCHITALSNTAVTVRCVKTNNDATENGTEIQIIAIGDA